MRIILFSLMMLLLPLRLCAQQLKETGSSAKDLVPEGWECTEADGDLNKDGISDMAIIVTPNDPTHLKTREDGYVYNFNQPTLAIYKGKHEGGYQLWKKYDDILPARPDEFTFMEHSLDITDRGVLRINVSEFHSAGGWTQPSATYVVRFQNGDFFLIGKDLNSFARNTGEAETISYNYLTHRCQHIIHNVMDDSVKPKEKWSKLPKKDLERLGTFLMEAY